MLRTPLRALAIAIALSLIGTFPTSATPLDLSGIDKLVVFGDSLVDAGNIHSFAPSVNPESAGYFDGRFTNGPDYTDLLSRRLFGSFTEPSLLGGNNFAFGGARVVDNGDPFSLDLEVQIDLHLLPRGGAADADALYVITVGGNDARALQRGDIGGRTPEAYSALVVSTLADQVQRLSAAGATQIFVTGIPNLASLDDLVMAELNAIEASLLANLQLFDFDPFFATLVADPTLFGLPADAFSISIDPQVNCLSERGPSPDIDCSGFFFFDSVHPEARVHQALFLAVADELGISLIPAPAALGLMLLGFGVLAAKRRRG